MKLRKLKSMIDYLVEKYPASLDDYIATGHDQIFLPLPNPDDVELLLKVEELGFYIDEDSIYGNV